MLEAILSQGKREVSLFGLTQWDKGQKLSLTFDNMPEVFQIHFSVRGSTEATVVEVKTKNGRAISEIPDELLTHEGDINAWIYLTGEDTGETVGRVILYVRPRPRPKGYIEDLVPSQQKLVENMITDLKADLDSVKENGVDSVYVPSYVRNEAQRVAENVLSCQNENTVSFTLAADTHYDAGDYNSVKSTEHLGQAMGLISSVCNIDFSAFLGGYILDSADKNISDAKTEIISVNKVLYPAFGDKAQFRCQGPDEMLSASYYRNGDYIDKNELYPLIGKWCKDAVFNQDDATSGYCYKDFDKFRIRVICLNTSDFGNETVTPDKFKAKMSAKQMMWFCDALNLSSKADCSKWGIIIFSHYPFNYYNAFSVAKEILKAHSTGSEINMLDSDGNEIKYNFLGKSSAPVIAQFHAGLHNSKINYLEGSSIPMICVPNAGYYDNNMFADDRFSSDEKLIYGEEITYHKIAGTKDDTAFCVATMDLQKGKIYLHSYGAAYDRELSFDSMGNIPVIPEPGGNPDIGGDTPDIGDENTNYTNLVPESIDDSENIFNRCGYKNDFSLDSSGEASSRSGFTCTGYIPCTVGDIMRLKGGEWSSESGNILVAYDESFIPLWSASLNGAPDTGSGMSYSDDVAVFDSNAVSNGELSDMVYIRVSCKGNGESLIVTANEVISSDTQEGGGNEGDIPVAPPVIEYNNIIKFATDDSGDPFNNGMGYKDGYCLDENGEENRSAEYTVTGFFYGELGSVFRLKGADLTDEENSWLIIYDMDYIPMAALQLNSEGDGISLDSEILIFDSTLVSSCDLTDEFFIRFSTKASGSDLIITYNQEIS